eukprot:scpid108982/ scgid28994/ 
MYRSYGCAVKCLDAFPYLSCAITAFHTDMVHCVLFSMNVLLVVVLGQAVPVHLVGRLQHTVLRVCCVSQYWSSVNRALDYFADHGLSAAKFVHMHTLKALQLALSYTTGLLCLSTNVHHTRACFACVWLIAVCLGVIWN